MFFEEADDDNMVEFPHAGKDIDIFLMEYKTSRSVTFASLFSLEFLYVCYLLGTVYSQDCLSLMYVCMCTSPGNNLVYIGTYIHTLQM